MGGGVGEHDRGAGHGQGVAHGLLGHVGEVHQHPEAVHLQDDFLKAEETLVRGGNKMWAGG